MPKHAPLSINISPVIKGYKSISNLEWRDIPGFSIITGRNGSGKTQLLEILSYCLTNTYPVGGPLDVSVSFQGSQFDADEVGFVPSSGRFNGGGASISQIQSARQSMYQNIEAAHSYINDPHQTSRLKRVEKVVKGRDWREITNHGQSQLDDDEFLSLLVDLDVGQHLALIFMDYRLRSADEADRLRSGLPARGKPLGPAPWDVVNDALVVAGFPYEVVDPRDVGITDHYEFRVRDKTSKAEIRPVDLSSGEQVLLQLVLWLFSSSKGDLFPRLLLLDEPDAHLHPSMTVQFLDVISEVLVKKHGVRVIMTTHSPSTVALAPENSLFHMERGGSEVLAVSDKQALISVLTAGLITVSAASRFCFVEDEDDVLFYNAILEILTDTGPSRDPRAIKPVPTLVFLAASIGRGASKQSGGNTVVAKWVQKLDAPPLDTTFYGVIDRDSGAASPSARIKVIGRYSFENYLLDPLNIFGLLLENGSAPAVKGVVISGGDEHLLRKQSAAKLQRIADVITSKIELDHPSLAGSAKVMVSYTTGQKINLPTWAIDHRGHDLLPMYQKSWGGFQLVNPVRLLKVVRRVRLIPVELAQVFADLQA